ncbi:MAG: hypothetical protein ACJ71P_02810 [Nitrososphaeraceae archaeon]
MDEEQNIPENKERIISTVNNENNSPGENVLTPQQTVPIIQSESPVMEVHKHPHHVTHKKKWGEYLLEFFMLFFAVFLGFVAENIREHMVEKDRAKQYAKSLISDLQKDTSMINEELFELNHSIKDIDSLCLYVKGKTINQISNLELFERAFINMGFYRPYKWSRASIEQLKSSGSLRYFNNDSIVYKISSYDAGTRHMDQDYQTDENLRGKVFQQRELIIDQNYPNELFLLRVSNYDSLKTTTSYQRLKNENIRLLTTDIKDIKILVNEYQTLKFLLTVRRIDELPDLVKEATELIQLLKEEYHLN